MTGFAHRIRRLRVLAHFMPSGWVVELAGLLALVLWGIEIWGRGG